MQCLMIKQEVFIHKVQGNITSEFIGDSQLTLEFSVMYTGIYRYTGIPWLCDR